MPHALPDDVVLLLSSDGKRFTIRLDPAGALHTHRGVLAHSELIGSPFGSVVKSHLGLRFTLLRPSMDELLMDLPRATQIIYPKDIGYILLKLSILPGRRVIEAGTGSGILTIALARYVNPGGHVFSYEMRPEIQAWARRNLDTVGLLDSVTLHARDISQGFDETEVDALFLDVREPWLYLEQARAAMADDAFFGAIVPTMNQVVNLVAALDQQPFEGIEISELMLRQYKPLPERIRPQDRMTAHTGYLIFARKKMRGLQLVRASVGGEELSVDFVGNAPPADIHEDDLPTDDGLRPPGYVDFQ